MNQNLWTAVDQYLVDHLITPDRHLDEALAAAEAAGLPTINVSPAQGKLLHLIARIQGARRILEIGTLGGYSTLWLARALPSGGRLITLELNPKHATVAASSLKQAGVSSLVEIRVGAALDSLAALHAEASEPFDLIFIDADKPNNPNYLDWALKLSRLGTVILTDNVIRDGKILDPESTDPSVTGTRAFFEKAANHPRLDTTAIQTVGVKGYDGFALSIVKP